MPHKVNLYDLLDIPKGATLEEIRRAYFDSARRLHPDVNVESGQTELFLQVKEAFEVLTDPKNREEYDKELATESTDPIDIYTQYSRASLSVLEEPQLIYTLFDISAGEKSKSLPTSSLNLCLVLDHSTSMQGVRLDTVKASAVELIRQVRSEDLLSVVIFSDRAEVLIPAERRPDRNLIETNIQMMRAVGGTEIFQGLEAGFSEVCRNSTRSLINHILLLTDGRTYGDEDACMKLADRAAAQGVRITGIGIGTDWNDVLLDELAARSGGSSFYVSRISDLRSFLKDKFDGLHQSYAERVTMNLQTETGVTLSSSFRLQPDPSILPESSSIRLGSIPKTSKLSILLEFTVQPFSSDTQRLRIATGDISLVLPSEPTITHSVPILLSRVTSKDVSAELPPKRIFRALSQINLYRMQENARKEIANGKIQEASLRLQHLATQLNSLGELELAHTAVVEAERILQTHTISAEGEKRIKYGTRTFNLPAVTEGGKRL